jgi:hypothetical protein
VGKQKRSRRAERQRTRPCAGEQDVERMIVIAAEACWAKEHDRFDEAIGLLEHGPPHSGADGPRLVDDLIGTALLYALRRAWNSGWQPADVFRATGRSLGRTQAELSVDIVARDMATYDVGTVHPYWRDQVADLRATVWWTEDEPHLSQWARRSSLSRAAALRDATALLSLLHHLPSLPVLCPIPGRPDLGMTSGDTSWAAPSGGSSPELERIRALLTKAESTTFPEEAEALSAKAQQLMAVHSIDRITLASEHGDRRPIGRRLGIDNPYADAKSLLLDKVASANRCRSVWTPDVGFSTVFGDEGDVASVDILFTSLLTQAAALLRIADQQRQAAGEGRARAFRQSFHVAYALRIGTRLVEVMAATEVAAEASYGPNLLPVLAGHAEDVDEAVDGAFPGLVHRSISASSRAGWASGVAAAEAANLTIHPEVDESASR